MSVSKDGKQPYRKENRKQKNKHEEKYKIYYNTELKEGFYFGGTRFCINHTIWLAASYSGFLLFTTFLVCFLSTSSHPSSTFGKTLCHSRKGQNELL